MYMTMVPLAEARAQLSKLVDDAIRTHERVEVTRNGRRAAVIMSADDYDTMMETLDILGDAATMADICEAATLTDEQWIPGEVVKAERRAVGRLHS